MQHVEVLPDFHKGDKLLWLGGIQQPGSECCFHCLALGFSVLGLFGSFYFLSCATIYVPLIPLPRLEVYDKDWSLAKHNHERPPSNRVGRAPTTMAHYRAVSWSCQDIGKKDDFLGKCEIAAAKALTGQREVFGSQEPGGVVGCSCKLPHSTLAVQIHPGSSCVANLGSRIWRILWGVSCCV